MKEKSHFRDNIKRIIINSYTFASVSSAISSGNLVFFVGGYNDGHQTNIVDIYNTQNKTWTTSKLSVPRLIHAATLSGNLVFFGGGAVLSKVIDIYDTKQINGQHQN